MSVARPLWLLSTYSAAAAGAVILVSALAAGEGGGGQDWTPIAFGAGVIVTSAAVLTPYRLQRRNHWPHWIGAGVLALLALAAMRLAPQFAPGAALATALILSMAISDRGGWAPALLASALVGIGILGVVHHDPHSPTDWLAMLSSVGALEGLAAILLGLGSLSRSTSVNPTRAPGGPPWLPISVFAVLMSLVFANAVWLLSHEDDAQRAEQEAYTAKLAQLVQLHLVWCDKVSRQLAHEVAASDESSDWRARFRERTEHLGGSEVTVERFRTAARPLPPGLWDEFRAGLSGTGDGSQQLFLPDADVGEAIAFLHCVKGDEGILFTVPLNRIRERAIDAAVTLPEYRHELIGGLRADDGASEPSEHYRKPFEAGDLTLDMVTRTTGSSMASRLTPRLANILGSFVVISIVSVAVGLLQRERRQKVVAQQSGQQIEDFLEYAPSVAVMTLDSDGCFLTFNAAAAEITGYRRDELRHGNNITVLLSQDELEGLEARCPNRQSRSAVARQMLSEISQAWEALSTRGVDSGRVERRAWQIRRANGGVRAVQLAARLIRDGSGKDERYFVVGFDVTGRVAAQEAWTLRARRAEEEEADAREAERKMSDLLAIVSHEVKTPLTAIRLSVEELARSVTIESGGPSSGKGREIDGILRQVDHIDRLAKDLLDEDQIRRGQLAVHHKPAKLADAFDELSGLWRLASASDVKVRMRLTGDPSLECSIDRDRFIQAARNLIVNALKATTRGEVDVELHQAVEGNLACVRLTVRDTGPGFPPDKMEWLSKLRAGANLLTKSSHGGSGRGLRITYGIVRAMNGVLDVRSAVGEGTTFTLTLERPLGSHSWPAEPPSRGGASGARPLAGMRILIAEDSEEIRRLADALLTREGAEVRAVPDGPAAVREEQAARAAGKSFDIILLDYFMGESTNDPTGLDTARDLRDAGCTVPMIALTAVKPDVVLDHELDGAFEEVIAKPFEPRELIALCQRYRRA